MSTFADQVVLITGAANGLGRQLALALAKEGAAVGAIDIQADALAKLRAELPGNAVTAVGDVTSRDSLGKAVKEVQSRLGPVDLLIANAGIGRENPAIGFSAELFQAQIDVNLVGVANSVAAVLPEMIQRKRGHLVVISSLASYRGLPLMAGYCASKVGVRSLFESLRVELEPVGIATTIICPGWIKTALTDQIRTDMKMMEVAHAAATILWAIRKRKRFYAFPASVVWQLRLGRWLGDAAGDWLLRRVFARVLKDRADPIAEKPLL